MFQLSRSPRRPPSVYLLLCTHLETIIRFPTLALQLQQRRGAAYGRSLVNASLYVDATPLATKLKKTGNWAIRYGRPKTRADPNSTKRMSWDKTRVNIVDQELVDDVLSYLKPSLERHRGCDLISVSPGAGLFTQALHDAVNPRSHLLLEPDEELYTPFLQELLKDKRVKLIPKCGVIWSDLADVLNPTCLPNQVEFNRLSLDKDPPCNDTLLVSMNLSVYPKKKYQAFDSVSRMVMYQLLTSLRTSTLFQKYGRVRMLIWIPDSEKASLIPRTIQGRKRAAVEGELLTDCLAEVCGKDGTLDDDDDAIKGRNQKVRPLQQDFESLRQTFVRMRDKGLVIPQNRETRLVKQFRAVDISLDTPVPLTEDSPTFEQAFHNEIRVLQKQYDDGEFNHASKPFARLRMLKGYKSWIVRRADRLLEFAKLHDSILEAHVKSRTAKTTQSAKNYLEEANQLNRKYNHDCETLPIYISSQVNLMRDHLHALRQPAHLGPILSWDRRPYEPLKVKAVEFFPNVPCALLDIQPKAMHRFLRHMGPGTTNAGDIFDMILSMLLSNTRDTVANAMDLVWPGATDEVARKCGSLTDLDQGGTPMFGNAMFATRVVNGRQLTEVLEKFMKWPFRPTYAELVGRLADDKYIDETSVMEREDEGLASVMGNNTFDTL